MTKSATAFPATLFAALMVLAGGCVTPQPDELIDLKGGAAPAVTFTRLPKPMQLYPRDLKTGRATVEIAGRVATPGYTAVIVRVQKSGEASGQTYSQPLKYKSGAASFSLSATIAAELKNNTFSVSLRKGRGMLVITNVADVVAGDVFLINGQSNAEARSFRGSANTNQSPFVRSFGSRVHDPSVAANLNWCLAEGDAVTGPGAVGQWGLRLGRLLVDTHGIPVAILNGALGGQPIQHFPRDPQNPENLGTNYGRLLYRCRQAGVSQAVRAVYWYQGESDHGNASVHEGGFMRLCDSWKKDFPSISKIYVMQLRVGCGVDKGNVDLRDRQRCWPRTFPEISVLSPYGIDSHDGCHYGYDGYDEIAKRFFALTSRDLYGQKGLEGIDAPDIERAFFSKPDHTEITLVARNASDVIRFDPGAQTDFTLEGAGGVTVTGGAAAENRVILSLSADAGTATAVCYTGHAGPGPWVTNARGIGLLVCKVGLTQAPAVTK